MPDKNQIANKREDVKVTEADLLRVPGGTITEDGLRLNINVGILYIESWLRGVGNEQLILDRELDENGTPVGGPVIVNPDAPAQEQRYLLKTINDASGTPIPSIGLMIEI